MTVTLKYAVVERERRYLVSALPDGVVGVHDVVDRYVEGTRLRLRQITAGDGTVVRKLNHKVRLTDGPAEVACTSVYLDDAEWALLVALPARVLHKRRHSVRRDGWAFAVDELDDGTLLAEIDDGDHRSDAVPSWLPVVQDVSRHERWTGAALASAG